MPVPLAATSRSWQRRVHPSGHRCFYCQVKDQVPASPQALFCHLARTSSTEKGADKKNWNFPTGWHSHLNESNAFPFLIIRKRYIVSFIFPPGGDAHIVLAFWILSINPPSFALLSLSVVLSREMDSWRSYWQEKYVLSSTRVGKVFEAKRRVWKGTNELSVRVVQSHTIYRYFSGNKDSRCRTRFVLENAKLPTVTNISRLTRERWTRFFLVFFLCLINEIDRLKAGSPTFHLSIRVWRFF